MEKTQNINLRTKSRIWSLPLGVSFGTGGDMTLNISQTARYHQGDRYDWCRCWWKSHPYVDPDFLLPVHAACADWKWIHLHLRYLCTSWRKASKETLLLDGEERNAIVRELGEVGGVPLSIQRYKRFGVRDSPEQLWTTTMDPLQSVRWKQLILDGCRTRSCSLCWWIWWGCSPQISLKECALRARVDVIMVWVWFFYERCFCNRWKKANQPDCRQ